MGRRLAGTDVEGYFLRTLGLKLKIKPAESLALPFYLTSLFSLGIAEIEGRKLLFCKVDGDGMPNPGQLRKHAAEVRERTALEPVFVLPGLSSWDRARLIEGRIAFVVPGRQLYLPTLLIDLREHFEREHGRPDRLSYPAQFLVLLQLLQGIVEGKTVRELSRELAFSATTMSRAVRELLALNLVETGGGKARPLHFVLDKRSLWTAALTQFKSPIKSIWFASTSTDLQNLPYAGMSALSRLSMLNEDERQCFAISHATAKPLIENGTLHAQPMAETDLQLEVWAYDPQALSGENSVTVDPFSLYLSLAGENDERVRKASESLVKDLF